MAVNLYIPPESNIFAVAGIEIGIAEAGIRKANRRDLTVFRLAAGSSVAGVFTLNRFRAAPVQVCEAHLATDQGVRALVINTGNANAGTGDSGLHAPGKPARPWRRLLKYLARTGLAVFYRRHSGAAATGSTGGRTACRRRQPGQQQLVRRRPQHHDHRHATQNRIAVVSTSGNKTITITGISKGAGMISPNMATMLGYLATDAGIAPALLQRNGAATSPTIRSTASPSMATPPPTTHSLSWPPAKAASDRFEVGHLVYAALYAALADAATRTGPKNRARCRRRDQVHDNTGRRHGQYR